MRITQHLENLSSSAESLQALSISHPQSFQNTLLSRVSITQVIRDAEPHESSLFTSNAALASKGPDSGASEILKNRESSLEVLLSTIDKIDAFYPVSLDDGRRVEVMRHKASTLKESIDRLEGDVEDGRRRLEEMSLDRAYGEEDADRRVTEEMIHAEEEEILRLEQLVEEKSRR